MSIFTSVDKLIDFFNLDSKSYTPPIKFNDNTIGYSVKRNYPPNIYFKPPYTKDGKHTVVCLIRIMAPTKKDPKYINIDIGPYDEYLQNHYEYNFDLPMCPTEESLKISRKSAYPLNQFITDIVFDSENNQLIYRGNSITGAKLVENLFIKHTNKRERYKFEATKNIDLINIYINDFLITDIEKFLKLRYGNKLKESEDTSAEISGYSKNDLTEDPDQLMDILHTGLKMPRSFILSYTFFLLLIFTVSYFFNIHIIYFKTIFLNAILGTCFIIVTANIIYSGRWLFLTLLNLLINIRSKIRFKHFLGIYKVTLKKPRK